MTARPTLDGVLGWFGTISTIPRPSGHEQRLSDHLAAYGRERGWSVHQDAAANLIIRKPAHPSASGRPGMVIQGHLDMVAEKAPGCPHDFGTDPIQLEREGDVLRARDTTLGADNGMGVAIALALLDSTGVEHPDLEVLLTTGEEVGLVGAKALQPGLLEGRYLLNLDCEQEGVFVTSSAGGATVEATYAAAAEVTRQTHRVQISGLRGGHSGLDIDKGRLNGLLSIAGFLSGLAGEAPLVISRLDAPGAFNAINREASAVFAWDGPDLAARYDSWCDGVRLVEPDADLSLSSAGAQPCLGGDATANVLRFLAGLPCGVNTRSEALGIVESSFNVGLSATDADGVRIVMSVRSSNAAAQADLLDRVRALASETGATLSVGGAYPAWEFRADNPLQRRAEALYADMFGRTPRVTGVHGGLECGVLADTYPDLAMLSLGADILDAHTPRERVSIASVERLLRFVTALVETVNEEATPMDPQESFARWQQSRHDAVTAPVGNIALVGYQSVYAESDEVECWPATVRREGGEAGVRITAHGRDGVLLDGEPIDGEVFTGRLRADGRPLLTWGSQTIDVFSLDGSDYELRRYDAEAAALADFDRIDYYPYDPALAVKGMLRAYAATAQVPWAYTRESDAGHTKQVPGLLAVTIGDTEVELLAFADNGVLVLTFADATTGVESYAPGRFLKLDLPGPDGVVDVDFNRTIIPPCGFSSFYSCPLPPPQNRLAVPVRAGERAVRWRTPRH